MLLGLQTGSAPVGYLVYGTSIRLVSFLKSTAGVFGRFIMMCLLITYCMMPFARSCMGAPLYIVETSPSQIYSSHGSSYLPLWTWLHCKPFPCFCLVLTTNLLENTIFLYAFLVGEIKLIRPVYPINGVADITVLRFLSVLHWTPPCPQEDGLTKSKTRKWRYEITCWKLKNVATVALIERSTFLIHLFNCYHNS